VSAGTKAHLFPDFICHKEELDLLGCEGVAQQRGLGLHLRGDQGGSTNLKPDGSRTGRVRINANINRRPCSSLSWNMEAGSKRLPLSTKKGGKRPITKTSRRGNGGQLCLRNL